MKWIGRVVTIDVSRTWPRSTLDSGRMQESALRGPTVGCGYSCLMLSRARRQGRCVRCYCMRRDAKLVTGRAAAPPTLRTVYIRSSWVPPSAPPIRSVVPHDHEFSECSVVHVSRGKFNVDYWPHSTLSHPPQNHSSHNSLSPPLEVNPSHFHLKGWSKILAQ